MNLKKALVVISLITVLFIAACSSNYKDCNAEADSEKCMEEALKTCTMAKSIAGKENEPKMLAQIEGKEGDNCKLYMEVQDVPSTMKGMENMPPEVAKEMIDLMQTLKGKYMTCKIPPDMTEGGLQDMNALMMKGDLCEGNLLDAFGDLMGKMFAIAMKAGLAGEAGV